MRRPKNGFSRKIFKINEYDRGIETVISILFVEKNDENTFQSKTKYFSGHKWLRFEVRAKREL